MSLETEADDSFERALKEIERGVKSGKLRGLRYSFVLSLGRDRTISGVCIENECEPLEPDSQDLGFALRLEYRFDDYTPCVLLSNAYINNMDPEYKRAVVALYRLFLG